MPGAQLHRPIGNRSGESGSGPCPDRTSPSRRRPSRFRLPTKYASISFYCHEDACQAEVALRMRAAMCCRTSNMRACEKESGVLPWVCGHTDAWNACWCGKLMGPIFDRRETVIGPCPRPRTVYEGLRVSGSDGATAQAVCLPWVSGHTDEKWRWGRATLISKP